MHLPKDSFVRRDAEYHHDIAVAGISARIQKFHAAKKPYRVYHGSTNSTRPSDKTSSSIVSTSKLRNILAVTNPTTGSGDVPTILVEPNVSMSTLVDATLPFGLIPPVIMEFPGITAGGGFSGSSAESSSFREGLFERSVTWIEAVLPNGEVITATPDVDDPHRDLFEGLASSFGTMGVVTALRICLRPVKEFVVSRYIPVCSTESATHVISQYQHDPNMQFIDGIMYARDRGVVILGSLATSEETPSDIRIQRFSRPYDSWYYQHIESVCFPRPWLPRSLSYFSPSFEPPREVTEAVPIRDYLFRYDRGGFWVAKLGFDLAGAPFNHLTRTLVDPLVHASTLFHAMHKAHYQYLNIVQDVAVPSTKASDLTSWLDDNCGIYPLWLCPLNPRGKAPLFHREFERQHQDGQDHGLMLNFGVWGEGPDEWRDFVLLNRAIESKVRELEGHKCLYAQVYYTEEEFWEIYGKEKYDALRAKYHSDWLPSVYDKMKVDLSVLDETVEERAEKQKKMSWAQWIYTRGLERQVMGMYGTWHALTGRDYLIVDEKGK